jgi:uncharacterized protein YhaN
MFKGASTGDYIAVLFGVIVILRWVSDRIREYVKTDRSNDDQIQAKIHALDNRMVAHEATDQAEFQHLREAVNRIELGVSTVQAQIRFVAGGHNDRQRVIEFGGGTKE